MAKIDTTEFRYARDEQGDPVDGALLFVFDGNTDTLVDIYTDDALSVAGANPVVATSGGDFTNSLFTDTTGILRLEIFGPRGNYLPNSPQFVEAIDRINNVSVLDFGATRTLNGSTPGTDSLAAFEAAIAAAELYTNTDDTASRKVIVPPGTYYLSDTLHIRTGVHLCGRGSLGLSDAWATRLVFAADTPGIILHSPWSVDTTTASETPEDTDTHSARGAIIEGMEIVGSGTGYEADTHGVTLHTRAILRDLKVKGFRGHGIAVITDGSPYRHNANSWIMQNVASVENGGCGLYLVGDNSNAGHLFGGELSSNGRWGLWDASFLGNHFFGLHAQYNGRELAGKNSAAQSALVNYGGNIYAASPRATEAAMVATTPGTNDAVWFPMGAGSSGVTWAAAQAEGTFFAGGSFCVSNDNSKTLLAGCYAEGNQPLAAIGQRAMALGGFIGRTQRVGAGYGYVQAGPTVDPRSKLHWDIDSLLGGAAGELKVGPDGDNHVLNLRPSASTYGIQLAYVTYVDGGVLAFENVNVDTQSLCFTIDGVSTTTFGRPSAVGRGHVYARNGMGLGTGSGGRVINVHDDQMADVDHGTGDVVFSNAPVTHRALGWLWTGQHDADGTPGTYERLPRSTAIDARTGTSESTATCPIGGTITMDSLLANTLTFNSGDLRPGESVTVFQIGTGATTLAAGAGVTLNAKSGKTLVLDGQYAVAVVTCVATDTLIATGELVAV